MSDVRPALAEAQRVASGGDVRALLEVRGLVKRFRIGRFPRTRVLVAVNHVDLHVGAREVVALVGESGSGKSTLARVVARLETPSAGRTWLEGQEVPARLSRGELLAYRRRVQMIFQDPFASLNPVHTVGYILSRPLVVHGLATGKGVRARVEELLEACGLTPARSFFDRYPHELSGGQRQRVGIARALAVRPRLILADEPTSMLDVSVRLDVMNLLLDLKEQEGLSLIFITHDLAAARYMSDRIAVMYAGHLVEVGPADEVIGEPLHPYTRLLKRAAPKPEAGLQPERLEGAGDVPELGALPPGCPFHPRCPFARPECRQALPPMQSVTPSRQVRCVLYGARP
ncbi:ABC transporter ATP-binding protein [Geochorda subterranea]|uniref:ABC transporter ATP-binding protein n=1 Tax=Geochorda subterranea TaxID=3109564 RepID=A0ABZ1BPY6_9FIRM|nr:ABC transporter ATP-binding protein [Limnochorda sp. LNt]WRP14600.1 ABC transporter ATP-binding protein [Limnochorda sp. LNt]